MKRNSATVTMDFGHEEELSDSYCGLWKRNSATVIVDFGRGTQRQLLWTLEEELSDS